MRAICFSAQRSRDVMRIFAEKKLARRKEGHDFSFPTFLFHYVMSRTRYRPMNLQSRNCLRDATKEQMGIGGTSCSREIEDFIPIAGNFRIHEEDEHLNRTLRNVRGGRQWRPIAYIPGELVFTPANHPRVQTSYEGD